MPQLINSKVQAQKMLPDFLRIASYLDAIQSMNHEEVIQIRSRTIIALDRLKSALSEVTSLLNDDALDSNE